LDVNEVFINCWVWKAVLSFIGLYVFIFGFAALGAVSDKPILSATSISIAWLCSIGAWVVGIITLFLLIAKILLWLGVLY